MLLCYYYYMHILDNLKQIKKLDQANMLDSIKLLPAQFKQIWHEADKIKMPASFKNIQRIVINGMGGSGLPAELLQALYAQKIKLPLINTHDYFVPAAVNQQTLYLAISYSGKTEEILNSLELARKKKAKIFAITTGGKLGELVNKKQLAGYLYDPKYNLCGQPRIGLGYALAILLVIFKKMHLIKLGQNEIKYSLDFANQLIKQFDENSPLKENLAKQFADYCQQKIVNVVASEFLSANAHTFANQINENAKNMANYFLISELNHHLLEGLGFPKDNAKKLIFLFLESIDYYSRNQSRMNITRQILKKKNLAYLTYQTQATSQLAQVIETLIFSSYVSFYLAMIYKTNPSDIPWVNYFKAQLK